MTEKHSNAVVNKYKRYVDILDVASFMASAMGTDGTYVTKRTSVVGLFREHRTDNAKKRRGIRESTKRYGVTFIKTVSNYSQRLDKKVVRTSECTGAIPKVYRSDKNFGYLKIKSACMQPIKEREVYHLTEIHWPMYFSQLDFERYHDKVYHRRHFERQRDKKRKRL